MKNFTKALSIIAIAGAMIGTHAQAADSYKIDPTHAWVNFSINHVGWSHAQGMFHKIAGDIAFDKADVTKSSVKVQIDAASIDTNFADRNKDLMSPDFLNTAEFPTITFESTKVEKTGENVGKITGNMTIIGVTKPVTLDAKWSTAEKPFPWAPKVMRTGFSATGIVIPADFGMAKVTEYGLGPEMNLTIEIEAEKQ